MYAPLQSDQINELTTALVKAQQAIQHARLDSKNPHFRSSYASLESVIDATKGPLAEHGLVVTQQPVFNEKREALVTTLLHTSGQWIRSYTPIMINKPGPQEFGSGLSYARRYALAALTGIGQSDDDAETAQARPPSEKPVKVKQTAAGPGEFKFTFGKYANKTIEQAVDADGLPAVQNYFHWLDKKAVESKKPLSENAREALASLKQYESILKTERAVDKYIKAENDIPDFDAPWPDEE